MAPLMTMTQTTHEKSRSRLIKIASGIVLWGVTQALLAGEVPAVLNAGMGSFDGVIEAERQTLLAAQVSGTVLEVRVHPGDHLKVGEVMVRLDAQAANQSAQAGAAQGRSAEAVQAAATKEFERQKKLFAQDYISQAALDR
ncbi:MAG: biotin/lipoyl-binding protein, partial [Ferrovum sp.]|nr:biotin/lipoyl-binding protein [Ferrovum sp.]